MKNIFKYILSLAQNPVVLFILWFGMALRGCWKSWAEGFSNNYIIFSQSFYHALEQLPLYMEYPKEYGDLFLYGVPFTLLIAPFSLMPTIVGSVLWCLANAYILYVAIKQLGFEKWKFAVIIWLSYNGLYLALLFQQYNVAVAGFIIFSYVLVEKKKDFWAALIIVLGTVTKIYGIVGLAFFLFSKRRLQFLGGLLFWGMILFVIPMLYTSPHYVVDSYKEWFDILAFKNGLNQTALFQNISFMGMFRRITHVAAFSDLWIIIPALVLFFLPYFRVNQYENKSFRLSFLASTLLFITLFSSGTEESGYVTALVAVGIWYVSTPTHNKTFALNLCLLIFCLVLTALSSNGLFFSRRIRGEYIIAFALKALPCSIIWFKIIWEQLTQNFAATLPTSVTQVQKSSSIDIILPCYNPHLDWEQFLIEKHQELETKLEGRKVRFIVVNDGSKRGFTSEEIQRLLAALPDTVIVDNKMNKGKGAAVRSGLSYSDSGLTLYTDYDFPYEIDSICQVVHWLDEGYDVVLANRNHTYYSQLTFKRKVASYASRLLNFLLLGLTHTDTQGGLKGFNQKGKSFLASTRTDRYLFDTEFIYKASLADGTYIKEVPVDLRSSVSLPNLKKGIFLEEFKNLLLIAWRG